MFAHLRKKKHYFAKRASLGQALPGHLVLRTGTDVMIF
jgi:hypothetical protein